MSEMQVFELFHGSAKIGTLPGNFMYDSHLNERYISIHDDYPLKKGDVMIRKDYAAKKYEKNLYDNKFYIKDIVREFENYKPNHKLKVYFLTESEYEKQRKSNIHFWIPVIISIIALVKSFDKELIWLSKQLMQLLK